MNTSSCTMWLLALAVIAGTPAASHAPVRAANAAPSALVSGGNRFALELYARLAREPGNLCFSPFSVHSAMAMAYAGSRGGTARAMAAVMHFPATPAVLGAAYRDLLADVRDAGHRDAGDSTTDLVVANSIWTNTTLDVAPAYASEITDHYDGTVRPLDFARSEPAAATINAWVASRTHGRIRDLVPANTLGQNTAAVLVDAVFFRAAWEEPFSARATATAPFTRAPGHPVPVRMMNLTTDLPYSETRDAQVVSLRYADARHSLVVILPRATNGLSALEARLTPGTLNGWLSGLSPRSVRLALPRFTMTHSERLDAALAAMGMPAAFDPAAADFSGIAPARRLWISAVLHRAFVAVDETGTEAAAATAVEMLMEMVVQHAHPSPFIADHPFLFLIRDDRTGVILFMGRVADPS